MLGIKVSNKTIIGSGIVGITLALSGCTATTATPPAVQPKTAPVAIATPPAPSPVQPPPEMVKAKPLTESE